MKVLREGHRYELENFENKGSEGQIIQFIEKKSATANTTDGVFVTNLRAEHYGNHFLLPN